jgi:hypothetical protein
MVKEDKKSTRVAGIRPLVVRQSANTGTNANMSEIVSLQEMIARDARAFVLQSPDHSNRFAFYRLMEKLDPDIQIARNYLKLMIQRSYLGPRLDNSDEGYVPSTDFLHNVNVILSEMQFASRIGSLAKDLIRHGNAFIRVRRIDMSRLSPEYQVKQIESSEVIPPDTMTILSEKFMEIYNKNPGEKFSGIISSKDYFVINEIKDRREEPYIVRWSPRDEPPETEDGKPPEIVLPARDVLHVSWDAEGSQLDDSFGRDTYNVWGISIYESIIIHTKVKLILVPDYARWMRSGMPRWIMNLNMDDVLNMASYPGNLEEKQRLATESAKTIMRMFEDELYYYDNNPDSPTYRRRLPIEPDEILVISDKCNMEQKGGASSPDASVMNFIKECNRAIASAMGVPLTLFNYNEGSTYATSKITAKFMAGYGGGLLRDIETAVKDFLKSEFEYRGLEATPNDWENLYLEYDRDDNEELMARNNVELARANSVVALAGAARTLYEGGLVTLNQARLIMREGLDSLAKLGDMPDGDSLRPLQPTISTVTPGFGMLSPQAHQHAASTKSPLDELEKKLNLPRDEPGLENATRQAIEDSYLFFIEDIARKVEQGTMRETKP